MTEAGVPGFEWRTWASIGAPAGTPKLVIERLNVQVVKAVNDPGVREKLVAQGFEPIGSQPQQVTQWTEAGLRRMSDLTKRAGIRLD
jgi:tripartite-type tricarboxylate transporter receptor subunit TctC